MTAILLFSPCSPALSRSLPKPRLSGGDSIGGPLLVAMGSVPGGAIDVPKTNTALLWDVPNLSIADVRDARRLDGFFDSARSRGSLPPPPLPPLPLPPPSPKLPAPLPSRRGSARHSRAAVKLKSTRHHIVVPSPKAPRAYRRAFSVLRGRPDKTDRFDDLISVYARRNSLDPRLMKALMAAESEFREFARSPAGAVGLMQVMPLTAEGFGVHRSLLTLPEHNIRAGAAYLADLFRRAWRKFKLKGVSYKDAPLWVVRRVIAAYNSGPSHLASDRFHPRTRHYVQKVLLFYQDEVTDIRRFADRASSLPQFRLFRSPAGTYN